MEPGAVYGSNASEDGPVRIPDRDLGRTVRWSPFFIVEVWGFEGPPNDPPLFEYFTQPEPSTRRTDCLRLARCCSAVLSRWWVICTGFGLAQIVGAHHTKSCGDHQYAAMKGER